MLHYKAWGGFMEKLVLPRNELRISITSICNMKCVYCHNEGNQSISSLSLDCIEKLVTKALKYDLKSIRLTGGEPLLHPNIKEICACIKKINPNIQIGINTNGILKSVLYSLIEEHYIDRVVIGLDYFNERISKNSPIGVSSEKILATILELKNKNIKVDIAKTYNGDLKNTIALTKWAIENEIPIKIIEIVDQYIATETSKEYLQMKHVLTEMFQLEIRKDTILNEDYGYKNNKKVVSFFQSHCRIRDCEHCKNLHLRVMSNQTLKPCLLNTETEVPFTEATIDESLRKSLFFLGIPPGEK